MKPVKPVAPRAFPHIWMEQLGKRSVEGMVDLYLPTAVLVPTYNRDVLRGKKQLAAYFKRFLAKDSLTGTVNNVVGQRVGKAGVFSGIYTFYFRDGAMPQQVRARYTFVVVPTRLGARILTHHSSEVPK